MKTINTIEKIHNDIDTAQERLLKEAKELIDSVSVNVKNTEKNNSGIINKANRLKNIGFSNTIEVNKASKILNKLNKSKQILIKTKEQAETLEYLSKKYPFNKFLTIEELNRICKKYNLVYASSEYYIKEIPEKNLKDIEQCKTLLDSDKFETKYQLFPKDNETQNLFNVIGHSDGIFTQNDIDNLLTKCQGYIPKDWNKISSNMWLYITKGYFEKNVPGDYEYNYDYEKIKREGLFIAAPKTHFNKKGLVKRGFGLMNIVRQKPKDPIVFDFCKNNIIRVITKWGLEAEDPSLLLPINN